MKEHSSKIHTVEPFPNKDSFIIKEPFKKRYSELTDFDTFIKYSLAFPRKAIRVNTLKISVADLCKRLEKNWNLEQIPWCKEGFWITHKEGRRDIGNLKEHVLGYIYVQEASSMIPPVVLHPKPGDIVLDMCAAPGSKTTQLASMMQNQGLLIANDIDTTRIAPLSINLQRVGATNTMVTIMYGQRMSHGGIMFDKILLDAPCSGTGTISKSPSTLRMWNPQMVSRLASTQKKLIQTAWSILKPGGVLVYSTCSNEPEEDEANISWLLEQFSDAEIVPIDLDLNRSNAITEFNGETYNPQVKNCLRIWPQDNHTEGFFVTKIRKKE